MKGMAEFIIAKHRNGAVDTVLLRFRNEYARFQDLDEDAYIPMPGEKRQLGSAINGEVPEGPELPSSESSNFTPLPDADNSQSPFGPPPSMQDMPF